MEDISKTRQIQLLNFDDYKREAWEKARYPYSALLELTARCNMNCVHCYLQEHHLEAEMPYESVINILDMLYEKGILFITLTGGEIFTRKDFKDIYLYAKKKGFMVELFSNGLNVSDELVEVFQKYPPILIDISLYGSCEETYKKFTRISGAYEKVISNCKKLVNAGVRICLRTPVLTFTLNEIEQMRQIADEMGVVFCTSFEISPTIDKDSTSQQYQVSVTDALAFEVKEYFEKENRTVYDARPKGDGTPINIFSCKMGRGALVIDYEGNMFPCMKFRHIGKKVCKDNFDELWASYNEYYTYTTKKDNKCNRCDANYYCEVCPAEMDFLYGDMEYRSEIACMIAKFRKALYEGELATYDIAVDRLDSLFKEGGEKDDIPKTNSKTDGS